MPILNIRHLTTYRYRRAVGFGEHRLMMRPKESYDQRVLSATLDVSPDPSSVRHMHDVFGNCVTLVNFARRADTLSFESRINLEHTPAPLVSDPAEAITADGPAFPFAYGGEDMPDLLRSIERGHSDPGGVVASWARRFLRWNGSTPVLSLLAEMTRAIHADFRYAKRLDGPPQSPVKTLTLRSGTCRDFAVLMMDAARSLGLAARFVSGYIYSPQTTGGPADAPGARIGGGHTHAWVQVYLPSCGWAEFDPTNGIVGATDLVRVAVVRDPRQAVPLSGVWDGEAGDALGMDVTVELAAAPFVEPPFRKALAA